MFFVKNAEPDAEVKVKKTIVLDAMGSDNRPFPEVEAAVIASKEFGINVILVGDEAQLTSELKKLNQDLSGVRVVHTTEWLEMSDHIQEARSKKRNTMAVGMQLVKDGEAQAFVTAGNTGMAMYYGTKIFGLIPGLIRACLCTTLPVKGGKSVFLDIGANAECRPEFLVQFAQMGAVYSRLMLGVAAPRIGLIANGEEEGKGNELVKETYPLLKDQVPGFVGNIEGKELFGGSVDVAVTDGFTGNAILKSIEAVATLIMGTLKEELMSSTRTKLGAQLAKPAFNKVRQMMDPAEIGSAPLLGLNELALVGHGRSDAKAMVSAIARAVQAIDAGLLPGLKKSISENGESK